MSEILIHNTASGQKEKFVPLDPPRVTMYNCGPTVYDHFHIGNARNFVVMDTVRAHLIYRGYKVTFVQNFTDIDDKIIKRAAELGESWDHLARRFEEVYFRNAERLGIRRADVHPRATDHIPQMLDLIQKLIDKGLAYATPQGDVYYSVRSFADYGMLSKRNLDDLLEGARVEPGDTKRDPLDFALWKAAKPGEPAWETPWGLGRPGWHLECSAMSMHHLGPTIDIHSGGSDLVFPHHENECAQSCGASGQAFARYWIHNGFLTRNDQKMGKSLGNFFTIDDVLTHWEAAAIRLFLLSAHYRSPLEYSGQALDTAATSIGRIRESVLTATKLLRLVAPDPSDRLLAAPSLEGLPEVLAKDVTAFLVEFDRAMDDDFNTQAALGMVFKCVSTLNEVRKAPGAGTGEHPASRVLGALAHMLHRLGLYHLILNSEIQGAGGEAPSQDLAHLESALLDLLVEVRTEARKTKQFGLGDLIRDRLGALGIRLQDHPGGTIWLKDSGNP